MDLRLDLSVGSNYRSGSQAARAVTEAWVARNLTCISCSSGRLNPTPPNTPARDFVCDQPSCSEPYELKARRGSFGRVVVDGAYDSLARLWSSGEASNLLLMGYDLQAGHVKDLYAVHRGLLSKAAIQKRRALPPTARRAGWIGANILLDQLPQGALVPIVWDGSLCDPRTIRAAWDRFSFVERMRVSDQGWIADVLACLRRLPNQAFTVSDAYRFEAELGRLHPANRNVRPKIRQQLQVLVAHGIAQRITPGLYRLLG